MNNDLNNDAEIINKKIWFMEWFIEDYEKKTRNDAIKEACLYYKNKNDVAPNLCLVGKTDYIEDEILEFDFGKVGVKFDKQVLSKCLRIRYDGKLDENKTLSVK